MGGGARQADTRPLVLAGYRRWDAGQDSLVCGEGVALLQAQALPAHL